MNNFEREICLDITRKLSKLPGAALFNEPIKPGTVDYDDYIKKIKNPQDLGSIIKKLENNEYTKAEMWEKEMALVWSNAELYNGKDSYISSIARHMQKHCDKLKRKLTMRKIPGWMKHLYMWREKLDKLMISPPNGSKVKFFPELEYIEPDYVPFTAKEIECFLDASRNLKYDDNKNLAKIIESDSNITVNEENLILDVEKLEPRTMHALKNYVTKRCNEMGIRYPTP